MISVTIKSIIWYIIAYMLGKIITKSDLTHSVFIFGNHTFSNAITNFVFCGLVSSPVKTRYYNDE